MNSLKLVPEHAKKVISAFLAQGDELGQDPMSVSAPQANAYEFQSQVCWFASAVTPYRDAAGDRACTRLEVQVQSMFSRASVLKQRKSTESLLLHLCAGRR